MIRRASLAVVLAAAALLVAQPASAHEVVIPVPSQGGPVRPDTVYHVGGQTLVFQQQPMPAAPGTAQPL